MTSPTAKKQRRKGWRACQVCSLRNPGSNHHFLTRLQCADMLKRLKNRADSLISCLLPVQTISSQRELPPLDRRSILM